MIAEEGTSEASEMSLANLVAGAFGIILASTIACSGLCNPLAGSLNVLPTTAPGVTLAGVPAFMLITTFVHTVVTSSFLPHGARIRWAIFTAAGATGYWFMLWGLFYFVFRDSFTDFHSWIYDPRRESQMFPHALRLSAFAGLASGLVLGGFQWLMLRRHTRRAWLWTAVIVVANTAWIGIAVSSILTTVHGY